MKTHGLLSSMRLCIFPFFALCSSCSRESPNSPTAYPPESITVENQGQICFAEDLMTVTGFFRPKGCFSSSCTQQLEQSITVRIFPDLFKIRIDAHVVLIDPNGTGIHVCTNDCGGAGVVPFNIGNVDSGLYSIYLGEDSLGVLNIPPQTTTGQDTCLGSW